jgi:TonB family protein
MKANVAIAVFWTFYAMFLRRDTFFGLRRVSLMAFYAAAVAFPLVDLSKWFAGDGIMTGVMETYASLLPVITGGDATVAATGNTPAWAHILAAVYLGVTLSLALRFGLQLRRILRLKASSREDCISGVKVYETSSETGPFSFFGMIFISPGRHTPREMEEILAHERCHSLGLHSVDVIVSELMCIMFWLNPFVWMLRREVRCNLEYIADNRVLAAGFDGKVYQYHLLDLACRPANIQANIYNHFNVSHLKNRIRMMNKKRSRAIERTKYLILLPLAAMLTLPASIESVPMVTPPAPVAAILNISPPQDAQREVYAVVEEMPQYPGGETALLKFIFTSVDYPVEAQQKGEQGRVICAFVIESDGSITGAKVLNGISPQLDAEALRVIGLFPKWTPGKMKGQAVAVRYVIPVTFRLQ